MNIKIREAVYEDYKAIARIHILAWQKAYRGLVPDEHLDNLSLTKGEHGWQRRLSEGMSKITLVAVGADDKVLGYCCGGDNRCNEDNRTEPKEYDGELQAIYIHPDFWGRGIGRLLFKAFQKKLQIMEYSSLIIWCLKENRSAGFYDKMGGYILAEKMYIIGGKELVGISFGWKL